MTELPETPPEDFEIVLWSMGDANKDGVIDGKDLALCQLHFNTAFENCDFDGDGKVTMKDVGLCARNQGKTLQSEWTKTREIELYQGIQAAVTGAPNAPWYVDFANKLIERQNASTKAYTFWLNPAMQAIMDGMNTLNNMQANQSTADLESQQKLWDFWHDTLDEHLEEIIKGDYTALPETVQNAQGILHKDFQSRIHGIQDALDPQNYAMLELSDFQVWKMSIEVSNKVSEYLTTARTMANFTSSMTLGFLDEADKWVGLVERMTGAASLPAWISTFAMNKLLGTGLDRYYNSKWLMNIPDKDAFIDGYLHEHMTKDDFAREMTRLGYDLRWAEYLVKVTQTVPTVADALTAWRRGKIDSAALERIFKMNRLDPDWHDVFDVRKYDDLSLGEVHTLYDLGLADKEKIFETARRAGYDFNDAAAVTNSILDFPVRRLKLRQVLNLVTAVSYDVVSDVDVEKEVAEIGYGVNVANWIKKVAALRKKILSRAKSTKEKEKLLSLGDLKAAYMRGIVTEDVFRTELLSRGYALDDIQTLLTLMSDKRTVEQAGGKMYALSVIELLNAWRYEVITEDDLRNKLLARGLPLDEIETLIKTKRVQWQLTPKGEGG